MITNTLGQFACFAEFVATPFRFFTPRLEEGRDSME
jgi:hypothetical protein